MNLSPSFPTIHPETVCHDNNKWGSWYLDRELDRKDIIAAQNECLKHRKDDKIATSYTFLPTSPALPKIKGDVNILNKSSENNKSDACVHDTLSNFGVLNKYCRRLDGNNLTSDDIINGCKYNNFELRCIDPKEYASKNVNIKCKDGNGVYLCNNGNLSCGKCNFNQFNFEKQLNDSYLKKNCPKNDSHIYNECINNNGVISASSKTKLKTNPSSTYQSNHHPNKKTKNKPKTNQNTNQNTNCIIQ